jgi:hypothetical protein
MIAIRPAACSVVITAPGADGEVVGSAGNLEPAKDAPGSHVHLGDLAGTLERHPHGLRLERGQVLNPL